MDRGRAVGRGCLVALCLGAAACVSDAGGLAETAAGSCPPAQVELEDGSCCSPKSCEELQHPCGAPVDDGCGGVVACECEAGLVCEQGFCACGPSSCPPGEFCRPDLRCESCERSDDACTTPPFQECREYLPIVEGAIAPYDCTAQSEDWGCGPEGVCVCTPPAQPCAGRCGPIVVCSDDLECPACTEGVCEERSALCLPAERPFCFGELRRWPAVVSALHQTIFELNVAAEGPGRSVYFATPEGLGRLPLRGDRLDEVEEVEWLHGLEIPGAAYTVPQLSGGDGAGVAPGLELFYTAAIDHLPRLYTSSRTAADLPWGPPVEIDVPGEPITATLLSDGRTLLVAVPIPGARQRLIALQRPGSLPGSAFDPVPVLDVSAPGIPADVPASAVIRSLTLGCDGASVLFVWYETGTATSWVGEQPVLLAPLSLGIPRLVQYERGLAVSAFASVAEPAGCDLLVVAEGGNPFFAERSRCP